MRPPRRATVRRTPPSAIRASSRHLHPSTLAVRPRDRLADHVLGMAGAEGWIVVAGLARRDGTVDGAVQLAERVRKALGVTGGKLRRRPPGRAHQRRIA